MVKNNKPARNTVRWTTIIAFPGLIGWALSASSLPLDPRSTASDNAEVDESMHMGGFHTDPRFSRSGHLWGLRGLSETASQSGVQMPSANDGLTRGEATRADLLRLNADTASKLTPTLLDLHNRAERAPHLSQPQRDLELKYLADALREFYASSLSEIALDTDVLAGLAGSLLLQKDNQPDAARRWRTRFHDHPLLESKLPEFQFLTEIPSAEAYRVLALLPLTGDLANAGKAIRDGIVYQYAEHARSRNIELEIRDSESLADEEWLRLANRSDLDFIIGPLRRAKIDRLLSSEPRTPVLTLNRIIENRDSQKSAAYSLSLAVEDDAQSAVDYANLIEPFPRLLTLYTNTPLGQRTAQAAIGQLLQVGGSLGGSYALDPEKPETTIAHALGVADSQSRRRELSRIINLPLEYTPRVRTDLTAVLIQSDTNLGRQIRPLLEFYYLEETPVFMVGSFRPEISEISEDFKNSYVLATPWELGSPVRDGLADRPWVQTAFGTLTGIGVDAMELSVRLGFGEPISFKGQTGYLTLGKRGSIDRRVSLLMIDDQEQVIRIPWSPPDTKAGREEAGNAR